MCIVLGCAGLEAGSEMPVSREQKVELGRLGPFSMYALQSLLFEEGREGYEQARCRCLAPPSHEVFYCFRSRLQRKVLIQYPL